MSDMVQLAEKIAQEAHDGQTRRGGEPYIVHPARMVEALKKSCYSTDLVLAVAWLHDVIEDTTVTISDLLALGVSSSIIKRVATLTHHDEYESYEDYIKLCNSVEVARVVKIFDIKDNLADSPSAKQIEKYKKALEILESPKR